MVLRNFNMELKDTIDLMMSNQYKERFKAEFYQLKIRIEKLENTLNHYFDSNIKYNCSYDLLHEQLIDMKHYFDVLKRRAEIEHVILED